MQKAIQIRKKLDAIFINFNQELAFFGSLQFLRGFFSWKNRSNFTHAMFFPCAQAKHLKSARISHEGFIPPHNDRQPTYLFYDLFSRLEMEVVGIGDKHLAATVN